MNPNELFTELQLKAYTGNIENVTIEQILMVERIVAKALKEVLGNDRTIKSMDVNPDIQQKRLHLSYIAVIARSIDKNNSDRPVFSAITDDEIQQIRNVFELLLSSATAPSPSASLQQREQPETDPRHQAPALQLH